MLVLAWMEGFRKSGVRKIGGMKFRKIIIKRIKV